MIERYSRQAMAQLWSMEHKISLWLRVEIAVCEAWADAGVIPVDALPALRGATCDLARMAEIEKQTNHDVIAFLRATTETVGDVGRFLHLGLTSSDVVDTALALQIVDATDLLLSDVNELMAAISTLAQQHRQTLMIGRSHGIHGEPMTFGLKMVVWYDELRRQRQRLQETRAELAVGKLAGAVGTHATLPPDVEENACRRLGLVAAPASTQIIGRDRHARFMTTLALVASSLDSMATEIRHLQRTEVREAEEPFGADQQGSSAMPHKRNPILCERVCGLARVVRGYALTAMENVTLWHERDISHSSAERVILPDGCTILDYMLSIFTDVLRGLRVDADRMRQNIGLTEGLVASSRLLLALVDKGMARQDAYKLVQAHAMRFWLDGVDFIAAIRNDPRVQQVLNAAELDDLFDLTYYTRYIDETYRRVGLE